MKYRYRVLGFLFVLSIITYIDRICISVAGKSIQEDLGLSATQWGWILGAFALAYSLFEIPVGAMADNLGPRRVLTRIVASWSLFTALTGLASSFWQLIVVRFLFGAGEAGAYPNSSATISRWFPKVERARAQSVVWMASRIGSALTPLIVIPVLTRYGWHATFFIFGGVGVIWAAVWFWWFRDLPRDKAGVSAQELGEIGDTGPTGQHHSLPWKKVLRSSNFWWLIVMYHAHVWAAFFFVTWLHTFLENGRSYTKTDLVHLSWLPYVCGAGANLLGGFTSDLLVSRIGLKWARRSIGFFGHSFSALSLVAVFFVDDKIWTIVLLALAYAGSDLMLPVAWAVCLDIGGRQHAGAVSGAMNTAGNFGGFLTTVAFGYIVDASGSYSLPLLPIIIMSFISALAWLKIDATQQLIPEPSISRLAS